MKPLKERLKKLQKEKEKRKTKKVKEKAVLVPKARVILAKKRDNEGSGTSGITKLTTIISNLELEE